MNILATSVRFDAKPLYLAGDAVVPRRQPPEVRDGRVRGERRRLAACETNDRN